MRPSLACPPLRRPPRQVGDSLDISGPWGMHEYLGKGKFKLHKREVTCKKLGMMAGGTGITPMLQVTSPRRQAHAPMANPDAHAPLRTLPDGPNMPRAAFAKQGARRHAPTHVAASAMEGHEPVAAGHPR